MVIDDYNAFYIGQTTNNVKRRILAHWSNNKPGSPFDRFRAKDTTRIYFLPLPKEEIDFVEYELINKINNKHYIINSLLGGRGNINLINKETEDEKNEQYKEWKRLTTEFKKKLIVNSD